MSVQEQPQEVELSTNKAQQLENRKLKISRLLQAIRSGMYDPTAETQSVKFVRSFELALSQASGSPDEVLTYLARHTEGRVPNFRVEHVPDPVGEATRVIKSYPKYGLSGKDIVRLTKHAGGVCQGCKRSFDADRKPVIDHDHSRGFANRDAVRGLLCQFCNIALSKHMTPSILRTLAQYLDDFEGQANPPWQKST